MKKILIVDDDITLKTALTRYLENRGYSVQQAHSGVEALELFKHNPPDLIVSDVIMPYMDGLEFCRRLRNLRTGQLVPFIFLSSCQAVEDRVQGHQMGADDYLVKPFEPSELVAKIEAQLERSRRVHSEIIRLMQQPPAPIEPEPQPVAPSSIPFTPAEQRVYEEVIQGLSNKQIGDRLFISPRTVQSHISSILHKLKIGSRSQLILYAFEQGHPVGGEVPVPPEVPESQGLENDEGL